MKKKKTDFVIDPTTELLTNRMAECQNSMPINISNVTNHIKYTKKISMKTIIEVDNKYNIFSLLPYTDDSELVGKHRKLDDLYFIKSIVEISIIALESFFSRHLTSFDAQVGENLCQIRAYKIIYLGLKYFSSKNKNAILHKEIKSFQNFKKLLEEVIFQWEDEIAHSYSYNQNLDKTENVYAFINRHHLNLDLSENIVFIICSFFLTHFSIRHEGIPAAINLNFISRELHISKYRSKRLTHKYQLLICQLGCDFILNIAKDLPPQFGYSKILPKLYQISDENRAVLPCHITSEVIFHHIICSKVLVFFIIKRINPNDEVEEIIYFVLSGKKNELEFTLVPAANHLSQHCIVVLGVMYNKNLDSNSSLKHYVQHILKETPLKLILANTAIHPQYSGKRLQNFKDNPFLILSNEIQNTERNLYEEKLLNLRSFAINNGCSKENPSVFFLKHIYASKIVDEVCELDKTYANRVYDASNMI